VLLVDGRIASREAVDRLALAERSAEVS
jgi:hypothetical protein